MTCVTNERIDGLIASATPYADWLAHIQVCAPNAAEQAASLGGSGANVIITEQADGYFYITTDGFILEATPTLAQAEDVCTVMGWNY